MISATTALLHLTMKARSGFLVSTHHFVTNANMSMKSASSVRNTHGLHPRLVVSLLCFRKRAQQISQLRKLELAWKQQRQMVGESEDAAHVDAWDDGYVRVKLRIH